MICLTKLALDEWSVGLFISFCLFSQWHTTNRFFPGTQTCRKAVVDFLSSILIQPPEAKTAVHSFLTYSLKAAHFQVPFNIQLQIVILLILQIQARKCGTCGWNSKDLCVKMSDLKHLHFVPLGFENAPLTQQVLWHRYGVQMVKASCLIWCVLEPPAPIAKWHQNNWSSHCFVAQRKGSIPLSHRISGNWLMSWGKQKRQSYHPMTDIVKCQVHQSNTTSLGNLVWYFLDPVIALSMHIFVASWQWGQYRQMEQTMHPGILVTVCDFTMNYLNIFQDEPSEAHWDHKQSKIFPVVNWYRCAKANCPHVLMREQIFVVPTTQEHNHVAVAAFIHESLCDLTNRIGIQIKDIINWL